MSRYYDQEGRPMSLMDWAASYEDAAYRVVQQTEVGGHFVSTVWLGLDHSFGGGAPLIFETMICAPSGEWLDYQERYSTKAEAEEGHKRAVAFAEAIPR